MTSYTYTKADFTAPLYQTFPEFLDGISKLYGTKPALSWFTRRQEEKTLTYQELTHKVSTLRKILLKKDFPKESHIAIIGENSAEWIISFLAIVSCGHIAVCVDTEQSDDIILDMVRRSNARMVFLSSTFLPICLPLLDESPLLSMVLMAGQPDDDRVETMDNLLEKGADLPEADTPIQVSPEQTAEIVFTSGTTSRSKMVMLTQRGVLQNMYDSSLFVHFFDRTFCSLPFYHAYGLNCAVLNSFLRGCHLYINGDLRTTMRDLKLAKADTMLTVPLMLETIHSRLWLELEKTGKADSVRRLLKIAAICKKLHLPFHPQAFDMLREKFSDTLRLVISGGAHLSPEIAEEFELLGIQVLQGYGITECCPLISVNCNFKNKLGSVGRHLSSMEIRVEDGEIWAKGPSIMKGYYNDPEQTAEAMSDGWFKTGDLGHVDKDGFIFLTGRKKNLIVFKNGKKLSPETLEEMISHIPMVKEVVVSGNTTETFSGDVKLTATIYPDPLRTEGLSSYEILEHIQRGVNNLNSELPLYQQIQMVTIREKEFDKTGTKKIKRHDG